MIIVCPSCQARYKFDEGKLGQRQRAKTKCAKCGSAIEIENPLFASMTLPPGPEPAPPQGPPPEDVTKKTPTPSDLGPDPSAATAVDAMDMSRLQLAAGKRYSLAVLQGAATGQIYPIAKPRVTLGRTGCDINLDDAEASRQHATVEVLGDHAILRDLGSTNGTFVDSNRIQQQVLVNQAEFRIGSHVIMFIVTEEE